MKFFLLWRAMLVLCLVCLPPRSLGAQEPETKQNETTIGLSVVAALGLVYYLYINYYQNAASEPENVMEYFVLEEDATGQDFAQALEAGEHVVQNAVTFVAGLSDGVDITDMHNAQQLMVSIQAAQPYIEQGVTLAQYLLTLVG